MSTQQQYESLFHRVWRLELRERERLRVAELARRMADVTDCPRPTLLLLTNRTKRCYRAHARVSRYDGKPYLEFARRAIHRGRRTWKQVGNSDSHSMRGDVFKLAQTVLTHKADDVLAVMVDQDGGVKHQRWLGVQSKRLGEFEQQVYAAFASLGVTG